MPVEATGTRVDRFLADSPLGLSRSRIQGLIEAGHVTIAGRPVRAAHRLLGGERIGVVVPPPEPSLVTPQALPFGILYEDKDLVVIDKPAGLTVHPSATQRGGTLVNALLARLTDLSGIGGELRPGIVHRLDKNTSGLMVVAKHDRSHEFLARQFAAREVDKRYVAFVLGAPPASGEWTQPIGRHPTERKRFSTRATSAKPAHTRFVRTEAFGKAAELEVELLTGRTHQIRVHAADNGFPLIGDTTYGGVKRARQLPAGPLKTLLAEFPRQALHARRLTIALPSSGRRRCFEAPLPADLIALRAGLEALS